MEKEKKGMIKKKNQKEQYDNTKSVVLDVFLEVGGAKLN